MQVSTPEQVAYHRLAHDNDPCNSPAMDLNNRDTWPDDLLKQLERDRAVFEGWELQRIGAPGARPVSGLDYDRALDRLRAVLNNYTLQGYHCTRLTPEEIAHIQSAGMQLPNEMVLRRRIETLRDGGLIDDGTAAICQVNSWTRHSPSFWMVSPVALNGRLLSLQIALISAQCSRMYISSSAT
jgi:hypothetical protein